MNKIHFKIYKNYDKIIDFLNCVVISARSTIDNRQEIFLAKKLVRKHFIFV